MASEDCRRVSGAAQRKLLRLVCPAYPRFNIYSGQARVTTALGPICVATAVREMPGWDVEVIDENNYHYGPRGPDGKPDHGAIQRCRPADVVGIYGGLTSTIPRLYDIVRLYGQMGVPAIAGGQHFVAENVEDALARGIAAVVMGEGERTVPELLPKLIARQDLSTVAGLAYLDAGRVVNTPDRPAITDFDSLPIPDFSVLHYAKMRIFPVTGVRGCGMDCEFCTVKGRPRFASPRRILAQFASIYEKWHGRSFFLVDDLFGQNRREAIELCGLLRDYQAEMSVTFSVTVQIRLDKARDSELLSAMRDANINMLAIGFESPIPEELQAMNKRLDAREMVALTHIYHREGFHIHGMFIFGYPMPAGVDFRMPVAERIRHFRRFIRKAHIDTLQVLLPVPLPGTAMTSRLRERGRLLPKECVGLEYYDGNFPLFTPDEPLTPETMQTAARLIMRRFYRPMQMFNVAMNILAFPALVFWMHRIRAGWRRWSRRYWRSIYRTGGWLIVRRWSAAFRKDAFLAKLAEAKRRIGGQAKARQEQHDDKPDSRRVAQ
jgi:radical SAM superfamily enzyme YgiQ (UPF0313 family)